jgi:hypothetical protein
MLSFDEIISFVLGKNCSSEKKQKHSRIARYGNGNVSLQRGRYVTKQEKDMRKRLLSKYSFTS